MAAVQCVWKNGGQRWKRRKKMEGSNVREQLTWLLTNGGRATPLVRLRSDTITFRIFSIYRRRKRRNEKEGRVLVRNK